MPSGTVTFTDAFDADAPLSCGTDGVVELTDGTAACEVSDLTVGGHEVVATYSGDEVFAGSDNVGQGLVQQVQAASATALSANPASATVGDPVTLTATVTSTFTASTPTGTVTFTDGATTLTCTGAGDGMLTDTGSATCTVTGLTVGEHQVVTVYSGDDTFTGSTAEPVTVTVGTAATATALSANPASATVGDPVTLTATVTSTFTASSPTGTVTFTDGATTLTCTGAGDGTLTDTGTASCTVTGLTAADHQISAAYSGDDTFAGSTAEPVTVTVTAPTTGGGGGSGGAGTSPSPSPTGEPGETDVQSATSTDPNATATAASTDADGNPLVTAVGTGAGTVTVGQYGDNPVGAPSFESAGQFFDVQVTGDFRTLTITRCGLAGGNALEYWDGTSWQRVVGSAYPPAPDGCIAVTLDETSTPTLAELTGTVFGVARATVTRVAGTDRIGTALAISRASFPTAGTAGAVVLARADDFADSLAGTPLAVARTAPILLTGPAALHRGTATEIGRVLPAGGTVYVLGGSAAIHDTVTDALSAAGYHVIRLAGPDRYATAVAIAGALGDPGAVFLATGRDFADGLTAGVAAAHTGAVVLFTDGASLPTVTARYLTSHPGMRSAVGGPAAGAVSSAPAYAGADRYATTVAVARAFFPTLTGVGLASGTAFPDALAAGPALARAGAPLLLSAPGGLPAATTAYLAGERAAVHTVALYGGSAALGSAVADTVGSTLADG